MSENINNTKIDAFLNDVNEIYEFISSQKENTNKLIRYLENNEL